MTGAPSSKGRGRSSPALAIPGHLDVEAAVAAIDEMNLDQLRAEWKKRFGPRAPQCRSKEVVRGLLAWRIQAEAYGGVSPDTTRRLRRLAESTERSAGRTGDRAARRAALMPGTVLTREWRGVLHRVQVLHEGFIHAGHRYGSLSEVARAVTGTRWSGPRFFGLGSRQGARPAPLRSAGS